MITTLDVEFDTHPEVLAFVRGVRYQNDEKVDILSLSFFSTPEPNKNGKFYVSVRFDQV